MRALSMALDIPFNDVIREIADIFVETGHAWSYKQNTELFLKRHGWIKHKQPRRPDGSKYTGNEFCIFIAKSGENYVANIGGHHMVAIIDKKVWDIWDSTSKCIGNYWTKG